MKNVFYIHNPINYSIAKKLIDTQFSKDHNFLVFGRQMKIPNSTYVHDDGIWDVERTIKFFEAVAKSGFDNEITIFLPHTAFLVGKIIKNIPNFQGYFYIEEGRNSSNLLNKSPSNQIIDALYLEHKFSASGLMDKFNIPKNIGSIVNSQDNFFFDPFHKKYRGSFAISTSAFKGFSNRRKIQITSQSKSNRTINFPGHTLAVLPSFIELFGIYQENFLEISKVIIVLLALLKESEKNIVLKPHPQDHHTYEIHNTFKIIFDSIRKSGVYFDEFDFGLKVDKSSELSLLGFENYIVFGNSSATDYLEMFVEARNYKTFTLPELFQIHKEIIQN